MKQKSIIAFFIALVMVFSLTAPVFADRDSGVLTNNYVNQIDSGTGKYTISTNRDGTMKVNISIKGLPTAANGNAFHVYYTFWGGTEEFGTGGYIDDRGNIRYTAISPGAFGGTFTFDITVVIPAFSNLPAFSATTGEIYFKF